MTPIEAADPVPLITRKSLIDQGLSDAEIMVLARRGGWIRLAPGVYAPPADRSAEADFTLRTRAVAERSPGLVVSHQAAAALHGMPLFRVSTGRIHLIRPGRGGSVSRPGRQVHAAMLPEGDVVRVAGLTATSPARTLLDLGRTVSMESAVVAADFALRTGLVTPDQLRAQLAAVLSGPGIGAARRALTFADGRSESVGESRTRLMFRRFGLPRPTPQLEVFDECESLLGRVDLGLAEWGVLSEFDGLAKYRELLRPGESARDAVVREKVREDRFREGGWMVVRIVGADLRSLEAERAAVRRVRRALTVGRRTVDAGRLCGSWAPLPYIGIGPG